ncbi:3-deoxy-7-phosphoheptulonate synthase [Streptomyces sp. NPDC054841]
MARGVQVRGDYAGSAHFGWIGERTRNLGGAHLELARTVNNPVGVKVGPSTAPQEAAERGLRGGGASARHHKKPPNNRWLAS